MAPHTQLHQRAFRLEMGYSFLSLRVSRKKGGEMETVGVSICSVEATTDHYGGLAVYRLGAQCLSEACRRSHRPPWPWPQWVRASLELSGNPHGLLGKSLLCTAWAICQLLFCSNRIFPLPAFFEVLNGGILGVW